MENSTVYLILVVNGGREVTNTQQLVRCVSTEAQHACKLYFLILTIYCGEKGTEET